MLESTENSKQIITVGDQVVDRTRDISRVVFGINYRSYSVSAPAIYTCWGG
ncbi:MAG: hypothetical protein F6K17_01315 [Okeania sp. SIO3C4]|nr:hypothetical protein [Okeania sp. SIO3C4]